MTTPPCPAMPCQLGAKPFGAQHSLDEIQRNHIGGMTRQMHCASPAALGRGPRMLMSDGSVLYIKRNNYKRGL